MEKRPALGKGLSALIPDALDAPATATRTALDVDIDLLEPNDYQPRGAMDDARLDDLTRSIQANGIIQPIIVRRLDHPTPAGRTARYQIIAGERRWRAAQRANLRKVPVVVRELAAADRQQWLALALIENIQREDLNPIEAATAYQRLADEFHLRQEDIAAKVGKDRATVANYLRLLNLPDEVRGDVASGALSMGHARALLGLAGAADQLRLAREVIARGLSVRETEQRVKVDASRAVGPETRKSTTNKDVHTRAAEERLRIALGTPVAIRRRGKGGLVTIRFTSEGELQRLFEYLTERR